LLLVGRKKFDKTLKGHQQYVGISVLQIRSRQKIGTDHFQAIAAGPIRAEHPWRFQRTAFLT
jgi:hypothetical protein